MGYGAGMSTEQITTAALGLPLGERVQLAQALWESIDRGLVETSEACAVEESVFRAEELDSGVVQPESHDEAMRNLRRSL